MKLKLFTAGLALMLFSQLIYAQDIIHFKSGSVLEAWVIEKSEKEIKYRMQNLEGAPVISVRSAAVEKITFNEGQTISLTPDGARMDKRFAANAGFLFGIGVESVHLKVQVDYFVQPGLNLVFAGLSEVEGGGGLLVGANYYFDPYKPRVVKGFAGLQTGLLEEHYAIVAPIGLNISTPRGFDLKLGVSPALFVEYSRTILYFDVALGWRF